MHAIARSRSASVFSIASRSLRRYCSSAATNPPEGPIISSSRIVNDRAPPSSSESTPPPSSVPPAAGDESKRWSFLKFGLFAALTGCAATAGYATYAYSLDEVEQKTKNLRAAPANYAVGDDAPAFDKFKARLYSTAATVPAKLVEFYIDMRRFAEEHVRGFTEPTSDKLLPDLHPLEQPHVFTIVLDLNETLVYSDWKRDRGWTTLKRPGVDAFLEHLAQFFEIVVYSDQLSMYVDPIIERLDQKHCIRYRLSRGETKYVNGKHYRDLSALNRDPRRVIYISGHALESSLQPENCVEIKPWKGEAEDTALLDLIPFLEFVAKSRPGDIRSTLASYQGHDIAKEFIERSKALQRRMEEQRQHSFWRR